MRYYIILIFLCFAVMPGRVMADAQCGATQKLFPPYVSVTIQSEDVVFSTEKTKAELSDMQLSFTRHTHETPGHPKHHDMNNKAVTNYDTKPEIGGISSGQITIDYKLDLQEQGTCLRVGSIDITLKISPKVYIAKDYQSQSCWFEDLFAHEIKHVQRDQDVLERYKPRFIDGVRLAFADPEDYVFAPHEKDAVIAGVEGSIGVLFDGLMAHRIDAHKDIDTIHEYRSIGLDCDNEFMSGHRYSRQDLDKPF